MQALLKVASCPGDSVAVEGGDKAAIKKKMTVKERPYKAKHNGPLKKDASLSEKARALLGGGAKKPQPKPNLAARARAALSGQGEAVSSKARSLLKGTGDYLKKDWREYKLRGHRSKNIRKREKQALKLVDEASLIPFSSQRKIRRHVAKMKIKDLNVHPGKSSLFEFGPPPGHKTWASWHKAKGH